MEVSKVMKKIYGKLDQHEVSLEEILNDYLELFENPPEDDFVEIKTEMNELDEDEMSVQNLNSNQDEEGGNRESQISKAKRIVNKPEESELVEKRTSENVKRKSKNVEEKTQNVVENSQNVAKKRRPVVRKLNVDQSKSQICLFCQSKFENFKSLARHISEAHVEKLEERKQLKVYFS